MHVIKQLSRSNISCTFSVESAIKIPKYSISSKISKILYALQEVQIFHGLLAEWPDGNKKFSIARSKMKIVLHSFKAP